MTPKPDLSKLQSDIKRLKDYIAYKLTHTAEERNMYRPRADPARRKIGGDIELEDGDDIDNALDNDDFGNDTHRATDLTLGGIESEASEKIELLQVQLNHVQVRLEQSETESAVLIGRITAEKEAMVADRDLVVEQVRFTRHLTPVRPTRRDIRNYQRHVTAVS
jgi:hypothetical protein